MILCDREIRKLAYQGMITPFVEAHQDGVISFGLTSSGYDMRLGRKYKVFKNTNNTPVDPKRMKVTGYAAKFLEDCEADENGIVVVPAHTYILGYSLECFDMPKNLSAWAIGKSTYARCGIIVNCTPMEPGWKGHLTIEIANATPCPIHLYAEEGIAQARFEMLSALPEVDYSMKGAYGGKYQHQGPEAIPARVKD